MSGINTLIKGAQENSLVPREDAAKTDVYGQEVSFHQTPDLLLS